MLNTILSGGAVAVVGSSVISQVVSGTLATIYSTISYLKNGAVRVEDISKINIHLRRLDLEMKIAILTEFLNKTVKTKHELLVETGLEQLIKDINTVLNKIQTQLNDHGSKWFASYRTLNITQQLSDLQDLNYIMEKRIDIIIKLDSVNPIVNM